METGRDGDGGDSGDETKEMVVDVWNVTGEVSMKSIAVCRLDSDGGGSTNGVSIFPVGS